MTTKPPSPSAFVLVPNIPTKFDRALQQHVPSIDVNTASQFGVIHTCTRGHVREHQIERINNEIINIIQDVPPYPYVVCVGDLIAVSCVINKLMFRDGSVNLLRWNRRTKSYNVFRNVTF